MVASSADTIQTGLAGLLSPMFERLLGRQGGRTPLVLSVVLTLALNVLAIILATQHLSVLSLFVLADLLCATCCVPVIMGLSDKCHPVAALCGCIAGLATALTVYATGLPGIEGEGGGFEVLFAPGGLYRTTSLVAFVATPLASAIVTVLVGAPLFLSGYRFAGYPNKEVEGTAEGVATVTGVELSSA